MTQHNDGIIVNGGSFTAGQVAVGPNARAVQGGGAAADDTIDEDLVAATNMGLVQALITHFNHEELRLLCAQLAIDFEALRGESKPARSLELVLYCARRGRLPDLIAAVREERPNTAL